MKTFDVGIIGGGVIGSAIARELSKYTIDVAVFEKGCDVASGSSKANSGVVHSGINSPAGSLKARFCVQGNTMFNDLAKDLGILVKWVGKYHIAKNAGEVSKLEKLKNVGLKNGVPGLNIIDGEEIKKKERNVSCHSALWVPTAGIVSPYEFTIALAENAAVNKVSFFLETKVVDIKKQKDFFQIFTNKGEYQAKILVNAAGVDCRNIVSMVEKPNFNIYPCRGEYLVLDKKCSSLIHSMIYPVPVKELGVLGVHITPTTEGNIIIGPSAEFIEDPYDKMTTKDMMKTLMNEAQDIIPKLSNDFVINAYSGIRCKLASSDAGGWADFRIEESTINPGMINLLGIESPGLTAALVIAKEIKTMVLNHMPLKNKDRFKKRKQVKRFVDLSVSEQKKLIEKDSRWGRVVCRCEHITEAEVINALCNPLGATSLSSVKYRCRAGMGRCQGGFCTQHIIRIMEKQFKLNIESMKLKSSESYLFTGRNREVKDEKN